jgi:hypothetical protein
LKILVDKKKKAGILYFVVNKGVTVLYRKVENSSPCGFFVSAIIYYKIF